jgi:hypothetical protein
MCVRRKPISHISGDMFYPFSDIPVKIGDQIGYAEGKIYIDYTCFREDGDWAVEFDYGPLIDLNIYDNLGNELVPEIDAVNPQIVSALENEAWKILERCYEHALYD